MTPTQQEQQTSTELVKKEPEAQVSEQLLESFGTSNEEVANYLINTSIRGILPPGRSSDRNIRAVFQLIRDMCAKNPIEGMLYSQMIACHSQAMNMFKKGNDAFDSTDAQRYLNMADKFMRTYTKSLETLEKFKRGGKQHVIVENVVVNSGGQAIVGSVSSKDKGGLQ
ncbi:hypothetical protein SAMN06295888_1387 [Desulfonatronum zhilinae]|nr:hypothetical protein SAMN06295888_1387 [Desulfonatronum zhilinae]